FGESTGSATANPTGGVAPFSYSWDNGETTQTATALNVGLHSVMITDANGAQTSCEITLTEPAELTCTIMLDSGITINGLSDGMATVMPVGGTAVYTYLWDNGETTQQAIALSAGTHSVTVTDVNGCETSCEILIPEPDVLSCSIALENDVLCFGESTGSATANPTGGVAPFSYSWDNGESTQTATALNVGLHSVMITDANGAETSCEITINQPPPPNAGEDNATSVCEGTIVDLLQLVSEPGGTFTGAGVSGTSFDTTGLTPGTYEITYTVTTGNNCPGDTATINIVVAEDVVEQACKVMDVDFCNPDEEPFYSFYWAQMRALGDNAEFFSQNATHTLTFTEFTDGTALIEGDVQSGACSAQLYIALKDKKDWATWSADGGNFKPQGCDPDALVKEALRYYLVDGTKSFITTTGGDCLEEGTFVVTQRPDPFDLSTPNLGVHAGPGGALTDSDTSAEGVAGWAWMGPQGDEQKYHIDFNFHIECEEQTECKMDNEVCDGVDNDGDGLIDEDLPDSDQDGIPDGCDVCEGGDDNQDADGDGIPDACDTCPDGDDSADADNDNVPDSCDVCEQGDDNLDTDGDGVPDACDICDGDDTVDTDQDGVPDACDVCPDGDDTKDEDGDGVPDDCDVCADGDDGIDTDGDGIPNSCDVCTDGDNNLDADNDGVPDDCDICAQGDDNVDTDQDGVPDACDVCEDADDTADADGDGVPDGCDVCAQGDDSADADGDGVADSCDICELGDDNIDTDQDGVPDACDICAQGDDSADADGDGVPDNCDICELGDDNIDMDGDGVPYACDICPANDDNTDTDQDGVPDGCDICAQGDDNVDTDGDGVPDSCDVCEQGDDNVDTDGDGVPDSCDICEGNDDNIDSDGDGVPDGCDQCEGNDDSADLDGDGVADGCDICTQGDDNVDSDGDGVPDACDICDGDDSLDEDGDGVPDACDICDGDDSVDTDGDGVPDACDICEQGDDSVDTDGDGVPDACDVCELGDDSLDEDGNGIPDACDEDEEAPPAGCQTAYARYAESNSCFIDDGLGANRWGWTNYLPTTGIFELDLYSGAGQCVISNGEKSGDVLVTYGDGEITVTINLLNGFTMTEAQLYIGDAPYPLKNGDPTVASGQFPYKAENLNNVTSHTFGPIDVSNEGVHLILHAVTCGSAIPTIPVQLVTVQPYHKRFENSIDLEITTPYDAVIDVQFMDVSGKVVMKKRAGNVTKGKNMLPLRIHRLATEVHIMTVNTGKELIRQKVYFHK
ncbi:hypothetical protein J1G40_14840, partial [Muriicola sp. Z0-33]|nr:hypothetical protein [Muriicola sp. Z0-33]